MHKILLPDSRVKVSPVEVLSKLRTFKVDSVARMTLIRRTYSLVPEGPIWQYAIDKDWLSDPEFLRKRVLPFLEIPLSHEHDLFGRRIRVYREEIYPGIPEELRARMPTPERILSDRLDEFVRYMSDPRHSRVSPSAVGWQELSRLYPDPRSQLKILNAFRLNGASLSELKRLPFDNGGFFEFLGNRTRRMQFYSALDEADRVAVQEIFSFAQKNADAPGFRSEVQAWLVELKKSRGLAGSLRAKAIPCGLEGMSNQVHGLIAP